MEKVLIIGAGQMGSGIAQVCFAHGYNVCVMDPMEQQLVKSKESITKGIDKMIAKKIIESQPTGSITYTSVLPTLNDAYDFIIEAVPEKKDLKISILKDLSKILTDKTCIATNTSSLSITDLAHQTGLNDRLLGIHFMNPVPIMSLVELIPSLLTDSKWVTKAQGLISQIKKKSVVSNDHPGFIVNRILIPMINEAIFTLYENVASKEDIDEAMKLGANHPIGPLQLADMIGLDTCLSIMNVLYDGFKDSKYRACPLLVDYVHAGKLGKKSGSGFYTY
jgi:3-hydroxybutyryl-CoA dehydrogenase